MAALGHAFGENNVRGVFCSKNGGKTWDKILFKSDKAGAIDLSMDSNDPNIFQRTVTDKSRSQATDAGALGGLAAVLISVPPVREAWQVGGINMLLCLGIIVLIVFHRI